MSLDTVVISDVSGEKRFGMDALPMSIGTRPDCELRLPGPGSSVIATLDQLEGRVFLQPGTRGSDMQL
ncbi:MAG: hypothetical protein KDI09_18665, partial [Halioglobus sp.]|nr:hypothetical protein [Halioglobus sp.]